MFSAFCPGHDAVVLYSTSNLSSLHNAPAGIIGEVECHCGARFTTVFGTRAHELTLAA